MKKVNFVIVTIIALMLCSCKDEAVKLGAVEYYPSFLWVDEKTSPQEKTIYFDFSKDAKYDTDCFAEFQFVDNNGKPISTKVMQVFADGQELSDNKLRVYSSIDSTHLSFTFSPDAKEGQYQGYLRLVNHKLDRLDATTLEFGQQVNTVQWTMQYVKNMNPLAKALLWIFIIIVICLVIWFAFLRSIFFPRFGKFAKSVRIEKDGKSVQESHINFKGARFVVFSDKPVKQTAIDKLFCGKIKTVVSQYYKTPLKFIPKKKNALAIGVGYSVNPNPIPKNGISVIKNAQEKIVITLR